MVFLPKQFVADKIFCHGSEKGIESEQFKFKNVAMEDIQYIKKVPIMIPLDWRR